MNDETIKAQSYQETYEEKLERLPKVLEAYADDAEKSAFWKGDSGLPPALQSASDAIKALYAEAQELREKVKVQEWQPIETAPKDGTRILLKQEGERTRLAYWDNYWKGWVCELEGGIGFANPINWKPLDGAEHIKMLLEQELKGAKDE